MFARAQFAEDNYAEGVRYFECRFSPQLLAGTPVSVGSLRLACGPCSCSARLTPRSLLQGMSIEEVISAVNDGFSKAKAQFNAQPGVVSEAEPPYGVQQRFTVPPRMPGLPPHVCCRRFWQSTASLCVPCGCLSRKCRRTMRRFLTCTNTKTRSVFRVRRNPGALFFFLRL